MNDQLAALALVIAELRLQLEGLRQENTALKKELAEHE